MWLVPLLAALLTLQLGLLDHTVGAVGGDPGQSASAGWVLAQLWIFAAVAVLLWRVTLVIRYRPLPSVRYERLPRVTVIVPAFNEGHQVYETLLSLVRSDYPASRLHIIAIDDGSVDDTWSWIERAQEELGSQIITVRCSINRGKRHALYEGFLRAKGDIVVTVDSDSEVLGDTLRNLVTPFVVDDTVGAVSGSVRVLNTDEGALARMLDVSFTYAFEFMRASESMVDTVMCCPGALSAYRRTLVDDFADEWLAQTFFGRPANIGEDRAMTNLVLQRGHRVVLQSNAVVLTKVPVQLGSLCKMFLRWARSNVRETLVMGRFIFTRFRRGGAAGARVNFVWSACTIVLAAATFVPGIVLVAVSPSIAVAALGMTLAAALLPAVVFTATRSAKHGLWAFPYAVLSAVCLSWIGPYGLVTAHRSGWLTRQRPQPHRRPTCAVATEGATR